MVSEQLAYRVLGLGSNEPTRKCIHGIATIMVQCIELASCSLARSPGLHTFLIHINAERASVLKKPRRWAMTWPMAAVTAHVIAKRYRGEYNVLSTLDTIRWQYVGLTCRSKCTPKPRACTTRVAVSSSESRRQEGCATG